MKDGIGFKNYLIRFIYFFLLTLTLGIIYWLRFGTSHVTRALQKEKNKCNFYLQNVAYDVLSCLLFIYQSIQEGQQVKQYRRLKILN